MKISQIYLESGDEESHPSQTQPSTFRLSTKKDRNFSNFCLLYRGFLSQISQPSNKRNLAPSKATESLRKTEISQICFRISTKKDENFPNFCLERNPPDRGFLSATRKHVRGKYRRTVGGEAREAKNEAIDSVLVGGFLFCLGLAVSAAREDPSQMARAPGGNWR